MAEFFDEVFDVGGGAAGVRLFGTGGFEVGVEIGEGDDAESAGFTGGGVDFVEVAFGGLFFEFYFVTNEVDFSGAGAVAVGGGDDGEGDFGIYFAADEADGFV